MINAPYAFIFNKPVFLVCTCGMSHQFAPQFLHLCDIMICLQEQILCKSIFFVEFTLALSPLTIQFL